MSAKISILMSCYDAAEFLQETIDSILSQSEKDWELIVVNDFSSDDSLEILRRYAKQDARIRVSNNTSKGIIPALQQAYRRSSGAWITRMDADDRMAPNKLEALLSALQKKGRGYVSTGMVQYFSHEGAVDDGYTRYEKWLNRLMEDESNFSDIYKECVIPSPCWMIHRDDFERCDAFYPDIYPEDYDLCFRFYKYGLKVVTCKQVLHYWRDYAHRTSRIDPHYASPLFFGLKIPYFLELDYNVAKTLVLWGAGKKGKLLARMLLNKGVSFRWITNNANKIGRKIHDVVLEDEKIIADISDVQVIVAVAVPEEVVNIVKVLENKKLGKGEEYFLFC